MRTELSEKTIHRADSRGSFKIDWLDSKHTFSFGEYYNPERMNFGALRVLNDDIIKPSSGFGTHGHRDMEIISIPLSGALEHKDDMNNGSIIRKGEVQVMSAGRGVTHSEFNPSNEEEANFLQIWIIPNQISVTPRYEQKAFTPEERKNRFQNVVSGNEQSSALYIHQDAYLSLADIRAETEISYNSFRQAHGVYFFVISGRVEIAEEKLNKRDAIGLKAVNETKLRAIENSEILAIEVPLK